MDCHGNIDFPVNFQLIELNSTVTHWFSDSYVLAIDFQA
jgi:hypothetical protein